MNRFGFRLVSLAISISWITACGPKTTQTPTVDRGNTAPVTQTPGGTTGGGTGNQTPGTGTAPTGPLPSQTTAKSLTFFEDKILPAVKKPPCSECHAAPREVVREQGGLRPQDHSVMLGLLRDGKGPNDNKLFNMMRGLVPHPGAAQCATETAPFCALLQDWYRTVFGDGVLSLGRVVNIEPNRGSISGWAGISAQPTTTLKVRFFLDGPSGTGVALGEVTANLDAADNNIDGAHSFSFKLPIDRVDNKPHKLYAYAVDAQNKEQPLAGSPYTYTAFKPIASADAMNRYATMFPASCNGGCHSFTYDTKWGSLLGGYGTASWSSTNNTVYNKFASGQHGGPAFQGGSVDNAKLWFELEFGATPPP